VLPVISRGGTPPVSGLNRSLAMHPSGIGHMKVYIFGKPDPHTFLI
jgi:hypothetical protein